MSDAANHSPLAQFEVYPLVEFYVGGLNLSYTNASLAMTIALGLVGLVMILGNRKRALVPGRWQAANEILVEFVQDIATNNAGKEAMKYFPLIFTLFMFILFANLLGMVPGAFTSTSHIIVTFGMAAALFAAITLLGIFKHGLHFFSLFLPSGTPILLAPLMIGIEVISYFARPISLSIRLAANMLAGHILLKIMAGFVAVGLVGVFPFAFLVVFTGFELFVACLQAYIFTLLTCIYLNDALHLH